MRCHINIHLKNLNALAHLAAGNASVAQINCWRHRTNHRKEHTRMSAASPVEMIEAVEIAEQLKAEGNAFYRWRTAFKSGLV